MLTPAVRDVFLAPTSWSIYEDTAPALAALSEAGWRHVIVSNHVPELAELVGALGLGRHVGAIVTSARVGYEEPRPEIFREALAAAGSRRIVMVGDNPLADVQGARNLGLEAFLVRREVEGHRSFPDLFPGQ